MSQLKSKILWLWSFWLISAPVISSRFIQWNIALNKFTEILETFVFFSNFDLPLHHIQLLIAIRPSFKGYHGSSNFSTLSFIRHSTSITSAYSFVCFTSTFSRPISKSWIYLNMTPPWRSNPLTFLIGWWWPDSYKQDFHIKSTFSRASPKNRISKKWILYKKWFGKTDSDVYLQYKGGRESMRSYVFVASGF